MNPSSLPTTPTPVGAEIDVNSRGSPSFSLIKGFKGLGLGAASRTIGGFVDYELDRITIETPYEPAYVEYAARKVAIPMMGFGTGASLPLSRITQKVDLSFGVGARYAEGTRAFTLAGGASLDSENLTLAFGATQDRATPLLPLVTVLSYSLTAKFPVISAGYTLMDVRTDLYREPTQMLTAQISLGRWSFNAGYKWFVDSSREMIQRGTAGALWQFSRELTLGYAFGSTRLAHSLLIQVFL